MNKKKTLIFVILFFILAVNFFLNVYGNEWGLPSRWNVDEKVANVLHMAQQRVLYDPIGLFIHPTGYLIFLLIFLIPAYGFLKIIDYPWVELKQAASISWIHMADQFPGFATGIYIYARTLSALLGTATVYMIYLSAKKLYGEKTALYSAGLLSLTLGFLGFNHFAKYTALMNLCIVTTLFLCLKAMSAKKERGALKYVLFSFLIGGFGTSVHINGPLLMLPVGLAFVFVCYEFNLSFLAIIKNFSKAFICGLGGLLIGMPALVFHFQDYFVAYSGKNSTPLDLSSLSIFTTWINYFFELISVFSVPAFCIVILGLLYTAYHWKKLSTSEGLVLIFIGSYFLIITTFLKDKYPETKNIIAIVPLLTIFGGRLLALASHKKFFAIFIFPLFWGYLFLYSFQGLTIFKQGDTRHHSSQWIQSHIPKGSTIEVFDQLNYVAVTTIMKNYEIIYLGQSSKNHSGDLFFKWNAVPNRENYLKKINQSDSTSDFILIDLNNINDLYKETYMSHIPGFREYELSLFQGKKNYKLVNVFKQKNQKIESIRWPHIIRFHNLWWNPIPCYSETSNIIYVFQKQKVSL